MKYALEGKSEFERLEYQSTLPNYDYRKELEGLVIHSGDAVLDAGCGSGIVARYLASLNSKANVIGCDSAKERLELARKAGAQLKNLSFDVQDLTQLSYPQNTFDVIVCRYVLQHLPSAALRGQTMAELHRCLKPGGKLIMIDFDGTLYHLSPQTPYISEVLKKIEDSDLIDLRIGRKLPHYLVQANMDVQSWRVETLEFKEESLDVELHQMQARLENATPFITQFTGSEKLTARFKKEFLGSMKRPGSVYYYNKFISIGIKRSPLKLIK